MSGNNDINQKLQQQFDELSEEHIIRLFEINNDRTPLIEAIRNGEQFIWKSSRLRNFIADKLLKTPRESPGAPPSTEVEMFNLKVLMYLHYLRGSGIPIKGVKKDGSPSACEIVGETFGKTENVIEGIWKKYKKTLDKDKMYPLFTLSEKLGEQYNS